MLIIPVIDLSDGVVVHARQGLRNLYQPITSVLSKTAEPEIIIISFLKLYPFKIIYIADIDAIQKTGSNSELILELALHYKQCEFWIDAGIEAIQNHQPDYAADNIKLVLGSENKFSQESLSTLIKNKPDILLSLDFNKTGLIENSYLLESPSLWPKQIITMMLYRVGSNKGIDKQHLKNILKIASNNEIYVAGGVRNMNDLRQLNSMNIQGVLLATALHKGAIKQKDIIQFYNK